MTKTDDNGFTPRNELWFVPLGGSGEIGMNLNLYGCEGKWIIVDMGVSFGDDSVPGVDVVMPDPAFIEDRAKDLLGIVLTHAHEDHLGAVGYLWPWLKCPVYATPFAAAFLETKLQEEELLGEVPVNVVPLGGKVTLGPFDLEFVSLTHSIPEPNGIVIRTDYGTVFHTGDWKLDPEPVVGPNADIERLKRLGDEGLRAVVCDSTNVMTKGHSGSEGAVRDSLAALIGRYDRKVAVACFASNVARLKTIINAAHDNNREVCLVGRSLWRIVDVSRKTGYLSHNTRFLEADEAANLADNRVLYICTGSQGEPRAALNRIAWQSHPSVSFGPGDAVLFSSRIIPGNERSIFRLQNQLVRLGCEIVTDKDHFIHVSGHPAQDEMREMYGYLRPEVSIPVHGERRHLHEHEKLARECGVRQVVVNENGGIVKIGPGEPEIIGHVPTGRLVLDGDRIVPIDSEILRDRKRMVQNGAAVITIVMDARGKLLADPLVTTHGLFEPDEEDESVLVDVVQAAIRRLGPDDRRKDETVAEAARIALRRTFQADQRRKPLTDVHLVRL
ncbi:ribonuclease J [Caenispirillum bisanense]|uniref:Ribonuclease J n=1 Tax=Caenispirillum bisanense TaxID=414052 RepID=A0A286GEW5_9PROT|nr:ribonuclease J [Caenispirillum bisanense]SOD93766.1 ribonuclease J [Caenispirillum bisanense]